MLFHFNIDTILIPQQRKRKKKLKEHYYLGNGIFVQFNLQLKIGKVLRVLWSLLLFPFFFSLIDQRAAGGPPSIDILVICDSVLDDYIMFTVVIL